MRAFLAVELDSDARATVAAAARALGSVVDGVRWVRVDLLHVTLRFLGELDPESVPGLVSELAGAARSVAPFRAALEGMGSFPPRRPARVIWAGITTGTEQFRELSQKIDEALERWGLPPENRRFTPHVTIGRARSRPIPTAALLGGVLSRTEFGVDGVTLFESRLSPQGPTYRSLARCEFGASRPAE